MADEKRKSTPFSHVRRMVPADHDAVIKVADSLPEWFNDQGLRNIRIDLRFMSGYVACIDDETPIGFLLYFVYEAKGHIAWIGVLRQHQRIGVGQALLKAFEADMIAADVAELEVWTLGDSTEYEPYERTRAFYRSLGFKVYKHEHRGSFVHPETAHFRKALRGEQ
jgi:ribosomal protein S18 acetylase RimI-like enzyme